MTRFFAPPLLLLLASCGSAGGRERTAKILDIAADSCVLFVLPPGEELERMSNATDEATIELFADLSAYTGEAAERIEATNRKLVTISPDSIRLVRFAGDTLDFSDRAWHFIYLKKGSEPKIVYVFDTM